MDGADGSNEKLSSCFSELVQQLEGGRCKRVGASITWSDDTSSSTGLVVTKLILAVS